jgi:hypothetical protein
MDCFFKASQEEREKACASLNIEGTLGQSEESIKPKKGVKFTPFSVSSIVLQSSNE